MPDSPVINDSNDFIPMPTPNSVVAGGTARPDPIPFQFNDIRELAARILKRATEQGQQKIAAAQKQVAAMEKQASDKAYKEAFPRGEKDGFAKGEKEGREAARKEMLVELEKERTTVREEAAQARGVLEQLAAIMNENRQQLLAQAEGDLLLLSLDIAKRLVARELSIDPESVRPLAIEAMGLVTDRSAVTVRVNPGDYKVMQEILPDLKAIFPDLGAVKIEPDESVERGGIMAATREAEVDMRLATRLAAFEEAILGFSGQAAVAPWTAIETQLPPPHGEQPQVMVQPEQPLVVNPAAREPPVEPAPEQEPQAGQAPGQEGGA